MAYYTSTALLLALMVIAATSAVLSAPVPDGQNAVPIRVTGHVACAVLGNTLGQDITTVKVSLFCKKEGMTTTKVGQAEPNLSGDVTIVLSAEDSAVYRNSQCVATAEFPVAKCNINVLWPGGLVSSAPFPLLDNVGLLNFLILGL